MKTIELILSENVKRLRKRAGFRSREKFAEEAKIPFPTYRDIEAGHSWPEKKNLLAIADVLGCPAWELLIPVGNLPHEVSVEVFEQVEQPYTGHAANKSVKRHGIPTASQKSTAAEHKGAETAILDNGPGEAGSFGHTPSSDPTLADLMAEIRALREQIRPQQFDPKSVLFGDIVVALDGLNRDDLKLALAHITGLLADSEPSLDSQESTGERRKV